MSDEDDDSDRVPRRGGGRRAGIPNYNNTVLIPIIEEILPNGSEAWHLVAVAYKVKTGEANLRSEDDLKRNWVRKLCNNMKKPTGRSGGNATDRIHRCLEIQRRILDKTSSGILGASSDDDNRFDPSSSSSVSSASLMSSSSSSEDNVEVPGTQLPPLPQLSPVPAIESVEFTGANESFANAEATADAQPPEMEAMGSTVVGVAAAAEDTEVEIVEDAAHVARRSSSRPPSIVPSTAPLPPTPQPRKALSSKSASSSKSSVTRASKTNKTKNSTNRERGSVTKSIERIASSIERGSGDNMQVMLEMRKLEWEEAEERRRQEREDARLEREESRRERMEMEDRRERRFERQMQQHTEMMQTMMMFMTGGARGGLPKTDDKDNNLEKEGE